MRCINKRKNTFAKRRRIRRRRQIGTAMLCVVALFLVAGASFFIWKSLGKVSIASYEIERYSGALYQENFPIDTLCVTSSNISNEKYVSEDELHAAALFCLDTAEVAYAENVHEKLYPASTTKILTAYLALKYGNLTDTVVISSNAVGVPLDSSRAGFKTGDQLTLEELLYGLMLPSGNDAAVAIAEHISGSEAAFAELMNEEARQLGAFHSHFVNAHGYHDEEHYTTAYDLYLILKECVKNEAFLKVVSTTEYNMNLTQANGTYRKITWQQSNQFVNGARSAPEGVSVIGGKTGTTSEAGACLVLYAEDAEHNPYISIVMGADTKSVLYDNMTELISLISM